MSGMKSYYEILQISRDAKIDEILAAYRKRVLESHPDKGGTPDEFQMVRKAYEVLSSNRRMLYDGWLKAEEEKERIAKRKREEEIEKYWNGIIVPKIKSYAKDILNQYCDNCSLKWVILSSFDSNSTIFSNPPLKPTVEGGALAIKNAIFAIKDVHTSFSQIDIIKLTAICDAIIKGSININETDNGSEFERRKNIDRKNIDAFLKQYCESEALYSRIKMQLELNSSIYSDLNETAANEVISAEIIKRAIAMVKAKGVPYNFKGLIKLESICNKIILGKIHINKSTDKNKEDESGNFIQKHFYSFIRFVFFIISCVLIYMVYYEIDKEWSREIKSANEGKTLSNMNEMEASIDKKKVYPKQWSYDFSEKSKREIPKQPQKSDNTNSSGTDMTSEYIERHFSTGDIPFKSFYGRGLYDNISLSELRLINSTSTDAVVLLENISGEIIRNVFVKQNNSYTMRQIPEGRYIVKIMYGNSWNSEKYNGSGMPSGGFMKNVSFSKSKWKDSFDFIFEKDDDGINYPTYSLTLHKVKNGNMSTEKINKESFFN